MPHAPSKPHCTKLKLFKAIQIPVREQYKVFLLLFFYIKRIYFAFFNLKNKKPAAITFVFLICTHATILFIVPALFKRVFLSNF